MSYFVENGWGEPKYFQRDPSDIGDEMNGVRAEITALKKRYAALEAARGILRAFREDEETEQIFDCLVDGAKNTLDRIEEDSVTLQELQKEMNRTLCLLQRM